MAIYFQVICTAAIAYLCINMGMIMAWPSSTVLLFKSANTTLNRPMGETEISLLGSLPAIGSMVGNPIAGFILDKLGRKRSAILGSTMFVIAWSIIAVTTQVEVILIAMFTGGFGCTVFLVSTVFISEICQDSIRGTMSAAPMQFYSIGFLISYLLGGFLDYYGMVYSCLTLAVAGVLVIGMMKETPICLMAKGRVEEAANSIAFYRRQKSTSTEVLQEVHKIRRILNSGFGDVQSLATTIEENTDLELLSSKHIDWKHIPCWEFFKKSSSTQREFLVVILLNVAVIFQGLPVVLVYATPMFAEAVPSEVMSASMCSILLGIVSLISGFIGAVLTDVLGRRSLLIYSSIVAGICCLVLGFQLWIELGPSWIVPVFIYLYTTFYILGAGTVPLVVLAEVFVPEVKSVLSMLAVEWAWVCNFLLLFAFHPLVSAAGLPPFFFIFAATCLGTAVYCRSCLPETKGLPLDDIQKQFMKE